MKMKFKSIEIHIKQKVEKGDSNATQAFLLRVSTASILEYMFPDLEGTHSAGASSVLRDGVTLSTHSQVLPPFLI